MKYRLHNPVLGVPASSPEHGSLGWSSPTVLHADDRTVIVDPGGPGYQAKWDGWLAAIGRTRNDVDLVLLTHAHWDHVAAAAWFPRAVLGIARKELTWARGAAGDDPYLHPGLVEMIVRWPALRQLEPGDELYAIRAIATPGHTPGHLSYLAETSDEPVLITGDAVKNAYELRTGNFAMAPDGEAASASLSRIRAMAESGTRLVLGHDGVYGYRGGAVTAYRYQLPHLSVVETVR